MTIVIVKSTLGPQSNDPWSNESPVITNWLSIPKFILHLILINIKLSSEYGLYRKPRCKVGILVIKMAQDILSNKLSIIVYLVPAAEETLSGYRRLPGMWDANTTCKAT